MDYNGIFSAAEVSQSISTATSLIELQVPANVRIIIFRAWIGAAEGASPVVEVQEVSLYANDAAASAGTALTEFEVAGQGDAAASTVALGRPTIGASPSVLYPDAFHLQNGWLYLPTPEERIQIQGGGGDDNFGIQFATAPDQATVLSYGITWAELR